MVGVQAGKCVQHCLVGRRQVPEAPSWPFEGVWMEAAEGGTLTRSPADFARYFLSVFLVRQFTVVWVVWEFEHDVVQGILSHRLLMPLN